MDTYFSISTIKSVTAHLPAKLATSAMVVAMADSMGTHLLLVGIFIILEFLDILTRYIAQSAKLWKAMYPQTPGTVWQYFKFRTQARKWRYYKSEVMRNKSISKVFTYAVILFCTALCDLAMQIAHGPAFLLTIITGILCCTELLSCLENLDEAGVNVAKELMAIVKARKEKIK